MNENKNRELTDEELDQAVGGFDPRLSGNPKVPGGKKQPPSEEWPYVDGATPLPDPDFGFSPGGGLSKV